MAPANDAVSGLTLPGSTSAFAIEAVGAGSRAARAGIQPGDRLVRIDHQAVRGPDEIRRLMRARPELPRLLEIERGDRRLAMILPPVPATP
jgi:regulator of sigma E protease